MSVLITHLGNPASSKNIRQALGGAGLDCGAGDCVPWRDLGKALAHREPELIAIEVADDPQLDWTGLADAISHSAAARLLVGPVSEFTTKMAQQLGAVAHMPESQLMREAHSIPDRLSGAGQGATARGQIISVLSFAGSTEGAVVAEHLAAALKTAQEGSVALLEVTGKESELTPLMDLQPRHSMRDALDMWQRLDRLSFEHLLTEHSSGVGVLPAEEDQESSIDRDALNRLLLLSRIQHRFVVLSMGNYKTPVELETLCNSNVVLVTVVPEVPSLKRARRFLNLLTQEKHSCTVIPVVTRWGQAEQIKRGYLEEFMATSAIHYLPDDPRKLNRSINKGELVSSFAPRSEFCKKIQGLVKAVAAHGQQGG